MSSRHGRKMYEKGISIYILFLGVVTVLGETVQQLQLQTPPIRTIIPSTLISCKGKLANVSSISELYDELLPKLILEGDSEAEQLQKKRIIKELTQSESFGRMLNCKIPKKPRLPQEDEDEDEDGGGGGIVPAEGWARGQSGITSAVKPLIGVGNILSSLLKGDIIGVVESSVGIASPPRVNNGVQELFSSIFGSNATQKLTDSITNVTTSTARPLTPAEEYILTLQKQGVLNPEQALALQQQAINQQLQNQQQSQQQRFQLAHQQKLPQTQGYPLQQQQHLPHSQPDPTRMDLGGLVGGGQKRRVQPIQNWLESNTNAVSNPPSQNRPIPIFSQTAPNQENDIDDEDDSDNDNQKS